MTAGALASAVVFLAVAPIAGGQVITVRCTVCHAEKATQMAGSVHDSLRCQECHGGESSYDVEAEQWGLDPSAAAGPAPVVTAGRSFEHGSRFRGTPPRKLIPSLCGDCHADVERMNPYGLRTDQLASYWISHHGKRLKEQQDDRVAVCTDCHGTHDVASQENTHSRTYFQNIVETCGRCHADESLMAQYGLHAQVVDQYRHSVHGRNVLERGDSGSPVCSTCHGSHAATPPGYADVGHVCGRCHQQIDEYLRTGSHGLIPGMPRCTACHGAGGDPRNHLILEAGVPPDQVLAEYESLQAKSADEDQLPAGLNDRIRELSGELRIDGVCSNCHSPNRAEPHSQFFASSDERARLRGQELASLLAEARWIYASTAQRVAMISRGVLLVREEALRVEDAKTELTALSSFLHNIDAVKTQERVAEIRRICDEINKSLDEKQARLARRDFSLAVIWALVAVFSVLMYREYLLLKRAFVRTDASGADDLPSPARRRLLDSALRLTGATGVLALLWPAVAYVLPGRRRGGSSERVVAGKESGWGMWEARKVSVGGKPVAVVRTDKGYQAVSLVCTHLGCIVHWAPSSKAFLCPCHAASFDLEGKVLGGPPPRPLAAYGVAVVQGEVIVSSASDA